MTPPHNSPPPNPGGDPAPVYRGRGVGRGFGVCAVDNSAPVDNWAVWIFGRSTVSAAPRRLATGGRRPSGKDRSWPEAHQAGQCGWVGR